MNSKTFKITFVVGLAFIATFLLGCERISDTLRPSEPSTTPSLKIGVIQPADYFASFTRGAELARVQINQSGGLLGMPVEFIVRNNQTAAGVFPTPETSVALAKELIEVEEVFALLGPIFSTNAVQVGPVAQAHQRLMLPGATGSQVTDTGEFVFLVGASAALHGQVMAGFATDATAIAATTAATIHQAKDVYSMDLTQAFEAHFQSLGGTIVAQETYQVGDTAFGAQLARIQEANPDVLLLSSFAPEVPLLIKEARELGITATFVGGDGWDDPEKFLTILQDNAPLEGSYYATNQTMDSANTSQFIEDYKKMFGDNPDGVAASGYDAIQLLAIAIKTAQSVDSVEVRDALKGITDYSGATIISHYDEKRHPVKKIGVLTIRDGQPQPYSVVTPRPIDAVE